MDTDSLYTLADLARVTGVTPRTVRYYIAQGLLPGANETGPGASYDERHLARLRLIRELQRQHLPLAEIRSRLGLLSDAEVAELLSTQAARPEEPAGSALDYIRGLLGAPPETVPANLMRVAAARPAPSAPLTTPQASEVDVVSDWAALSEATKPSTERRSQWDRIALTPDIELHVRRPLRRLDSKRVERLITIARQVLGEEKP